MLVTNTPRRERERFGAAQRKLESGLLGGRKGSERRSWCCSKQGHSRVITSHAKRGRAGVILCQLLYCSVVGLGLLVGGLSRRRRVPGGLLLGAAGVGGLRLHGEGGLLVAARELFVLRGAAAGGAEGRRGSARAGGWPGPRGAAGTAGCQQRRQHWQQRQQAAIRSRRPPRRRQPRSVKLTSVAKSLLSAAVTPLESTGATRAHSAMRAACSASLTWKEGLR